MSTVAEALLADPDKGDKGRARHLAAKLVKGPRQKTFDRHQTIAERRLCRLHRLAQEIQRHPPEEGMEAVIRAAEHFHEYPDLLQLPWGSEEATRVLERLVKDRQKKDDVERLHT